MENVAAQPLIDFVEANIIAEVKQTVHDAFQFSLVRDVTRHSGIDQSGVLHQCLVFELI